MVVIGAIYLISEHQKNQSLLPELPEHAENFHLTPKFTEEAELDGVWLEYKYDF